MPILITRALDHAELSRTHWKVWFLSAMGIFLDGFDLFIIAVALPLISAQFNPSPAFLGLIAAAAPIGCIFGASLFGRVTDKLGRKMIMLIDLVFFVVFSILSALSWSVWSLIIFRFLLGIGIGADYPVSSAYITENMPARLRGKMMVSAFGFQALGALAGAAVGGIILMIHPHINAWRVILGICVLPAVVIFLYRMTLPESPRWLINKGKHEEAAAVAFKMTGQKIDIAGMEDTSTHTSFFELFAKKYLGRTALTSLAWFLMDISMYGVQMFTPIILAALAFSKKGDFIQVATSAAKGSAFLDIFLVIGIFLAILLIDKFGRIKLQIIGFIGMGIGLLVLAHSTQVSDTWHLSLVFLGFILFNLFLNAGPNPTTYLLPAELFPTNLRATGHGFASAAGKVGAALGVFCLPIMKQGIGIPLTLIILGISCFVGSLLTLLLGHETKGKTLDEIQRVEKSIGSAEENLQHVQEDIQKLSHDLHKVEETLKAALEGMKKLNR